MTDEAMGVVAEAERGREGMLAEARAEVMKMVAAAAAEGSEEGAGQAAHMRAELAGLETRMLNEVEGEVVRAAIRVAAELLAAELQQRPGSVVDVAAAALQAVKNAREVNLRVNPRDTRAVRAGKERLVAILTRSKDLEIREDRRVKAGGVLIETESGVVDAQLDTQLEEIARVLGA